MLSSIVVVGLEVEMTETLSGFFVVVGLKVEMTGSRELCASYAFG